MLRQVQHERLNSTVLRPGPVPRQQLQTVAAHIAEHEGRTGARRRAQGLLRIQRQAVDAPPQVDWLKSPEQASLRRAFTVWLKRVFLPGRAPGVEFNNLNDLQEVQSMLAERVIEIAKRTVLSSNGNK